jgi:hypothetical protein
VEALGFPTHNETFMESAIERGSEPANWLENTRASKGMLQQKIFSKFHARKILIEDAAE